METVEIKVKKTWGAMKQSIPVGWYDIILRTGEEYHEVYAEHEHFHFTSSTPSIHFKRVEWIRLHTSN